MMRQSPKLMLGDETPKLHVQVVLRTTRTKGLVRRQRGLSSRTIELTSTRREPPRRDSASRDLAGPRDRTKNGYPWERHYHRLA
jgi:hypothetical protein